eukprot:Awhi_evm1s12873
MASTLAMKNVEIEEFQEGKNKTDDLSTALGESNKKISQLTSLLKKKASDFDKMASTLAMKNVEIEEFKEGKNKTDDLSTALGE